MKNFWTLSLIYCAVLFGYLPLLSAAKFHNPSISYLYGENFVVEPETQQTLTFEYAAAWEYIDLFMFAEKKFYSGSGNGTGRYGEFSPRLKLYDFEQGSSLKKLTLASTFERGKNGVKSNLLGFGLDLNVLGFNYLTNNIYHRDTPSRAGHSWQLTTTWSMSTQVAELPILFDGYLDWVFISDESEAHFHFNPQIKIDMKKWLGGDREWYVGLEYDFWHEKYGIDNSESFDTNQNTASLLLKYHF